MDVAVTEMAEEHQPHPGDQALGERATLRQQLMGARHRHRDVVADAGAGAFLRLGDRLADAPEVGRLGHARGQRGVDHLAGLEALGKDQLDQPAQVVAGASRCEFQQHIVGVRLVERVAGVGDGRQHQVKACAVEVLEGHHRVAGEFARAAQQAQRRLGIADRDERHLHLARARAQLQHRGGDDAERPFAGQEQLAQRVAGVVLAQPAQAVPDRAVGQHHLEAEHLFASVAVAQHVGAAGVGREVAADLAATLGGEAQREQQAGGLGPRLDVGEHAAGLDGHREVGRVELAHPVHAAERNQHLARLRQPATAQPGVAPLRHHRDAGGVAQAHDLADLVGTRRTQQQARRTAVGTARVLEVRGDDRRIVAPALRANDGLELFGERVGELGTGHGATLAAARADVHAG